MNWTWWLIFVILAVALIILWLMGRKRGLHEVDRSTVLRKWKEVEVLMEEARYTEAVLEADKVLDFVLKKMNVNGQGLGERLRNAESLIKNYDDVWKAHKVRNQLVHEVDFEVGERKAQTVINIFRATLKHLSAL